MNNFFSAALALLITSTVYSQEANIPTLSECLQSISQAQLTADQAKLTCIRQSAITVSFDECKRIADTIFETSIWDVALSYCERDSAPSAENLTRNCMRTAGGGNPSQQLNCIRQHAAHLEFDQCKSFADLIENTSHWDVAVGVCQTTARPRTR